jgi:hypothetical protein
MLRKGKGIMCQQVTGIITMQTEIMAIKHVEHTYNCAAARKYNFSEANIQRWEQ